MSITLKDLPVFPIYDDLTINSSHTIEQVQWLIDNGTLYRTIALLPLKTRRSAYQEIFRRNNICYHVEYSHEYLGDQHDQRLLTIHRYASLAELLRGEHIKNMAGCEDDKHAALWRWTDYEPAVISNGGSLEVSVATRTSNNGR